MLYFRLICHPWLPIWGPSSITFHQSRKMRSASLRKCPNLEFTVDRFENCVPHFLDLELHRSGISIYRKDTHTAQFTHYSSFTKWGHKIAWIRSLVNRAKGLCEPSNFTQEIAKIKKFAAYNGFPKWITRSVVITPADQTYKRR